MGTQYLFTCQGCNYEAQVDGGLSGGMFCRTATVTCKRCKELYDVVFAESHPGHKSVYSNTEVPEKFKCPKRHVVERWENPGNCPKCGDKMIKVQEVMLWD